MAVTNITTNTKWELLDLLLAHSGKSLYLYAKQLKSYVKISAGELLHCVNTLEDDIKVDLTINDSTIWIEK